LFVFVQSGKQKEGRPTALHLDWVSTTCGSGWVDRLDHA